MKHYIIQCLSQVCEHTFVHRLSGPAIRCPRCYNSPCRTMNIDGVFMFPLKKAKAIAKEMRREDR